MNSRVHFWVVCDAVDFIKNHGDESQKKALQTLQVAYGEDKPVEDIPAGRSAVEYLAGFESWHTDKYCDLALELPDLPFGAKRSITGFGGRVFTAFDHFINPFPQEEKIWSGAEGYSYGLSSQKGLDSLIMLGASDYLHARIDIENSPVLGRLRPYWEREAEEWDSHMARKVRDVKFPSWTALTSFYYSSLLLNHFDPLEVRGPNTHLVGLQILGPVLHAAVDSCSIQHVRPALGFGHPIWENYVQSKIYNREVDLEPAMIRSFLAEEPFAPWRTKTDGPLEGRFDVETFVHEMSIRTANRLTLSTGLTWRQILQADAGFWWKYLSGPRMMDDVRYIYHQAVAGTVHTIVRSCDDLTALGILESGKGLTDPSKMPPLQLAQDNLKSLPEKKRFPDDVPSEKFRRDPFFGAADLLGFEPVDETDLEKQAAEAKELLTGPAGGPGRADDVERLLCAIEASLQAQHEAKARLTGPWFCPLGYLEKLPVESDLSAHFGTATYRLPSADECNNPHLMQRYMDEAASHELLAERLQLTQLAAAFSYHRDQRPPESEVRSRFNLVVEALRELRRAGSYPKRNAPEVSLDAAVESFSGENPGTVKIRGPEGQPDLRAVAAKVGLGIFNLPLAGVDALRSAFKKLLSATRHWTASLMNVPVAALATVVTAVLVLVIVYPHGTPQPIIGLSSEQWKTPRLRLMGPGPPLKKGIPSKEIPKSRVAMIIRFHGFEKPPEQAFVDSLYQALKPESTWEKEVDFVPPSKLKQAAAEGTIRSETTKELLEGLRTELDVTEVILFTIRKSGDFFEVTAEMKDLSTGRIGGGDTQKDLTRDELPEGVRRSAAGLLSRIGQQHGPN
ncbi:MAG: hypothetical protein V1792_29135 [Pseudomonadota bacterium]